MRKPRESCLIDHAKSAETRARKAAEKEAAGLSLGWTRKKAILGKCYECANYSTGEVRRCEIKSCPLWPFRSRCSLSAAEMKDWERSFKSDSISIPIILHMNKEALDAEADSDSGAGDGGEGAFSFED